MKPIQFQREKIRQFREIISRIPPQESHYIRGLLIKNQIKLALLVLETILERKAYGDHDPSISWKLDAIKVLLDE